LIPSELFGTLVNLENIYLNNNEIEAIEEKAFHDMHSLLNIKLNNNKLRIIKKDTFVNLPKINSIDLAFNEIFDISNDDFENLPSLEWVRLRDNKLEPKDLEVFAKYYKRETPKKPRRCGTVRLREKRAKTVNKFDEELE
ncbi:hypothetical protein ILUMI_16232, partial [Ignelater luminosus]